MAVNTPEAYVVLDRFGLFWYEIMVVLIVYKLFTISEIDYKYFISFLPQPNQEVLGIDIIVGNIFGMNPLDSIN